MSGVVGMAVVALLAAVALAQGGPPVAPPTFSIDNASPTNGVVPSLGWDILAPVPPAPGLGPLPPPAVLIPGGPGGLGLIPVAIVPPEVDALSYGVDVRLHPAAMALWYFSVDRAAIGLPGMPVPSVTSEGAMAGAAQEASADVFWSPQPPVPLPPFGGPPMNVGFFDGNGLPSLTGAVYPGLGLNAEPNGPIPGDNLDAFDLDTPLSAAMAVYFSVDTPTAMANGVLPGDVLVRLVGGGPMVYAPAPLLGLDRVQGPGSDDLDALVLWENGDGFFSPSMADFDWLNPIPGIPGRDMLFFSVAPGSAVIGAPDSRFGVPIEAGDILTPPVLGGVSPFPGLWVSAESLGLATMRSGFGMMDNLDALDVTPEPATLALLGAGVAGLLARRRRN